MSGVATPSAARLAEVEAELVEKEKNYAAIGSAGAFAREYVLRPLRDRWNQGERTEELCLEIEGVAW